MRPFANIFTWKDWEEHGDTRILFMRCRLLKDVGESKVGEYFQMISFCDETSNISFYRDFDDMENDTPCMVKTLGIF